MRYLIYFSYDGSNFNCFQKQPNKRCVENMLEDALYSINNYTKTKVTGAGRTDHGVHAFCQCAHFDLNINITLYKLKCALNSLLPPDIHIFKVIQVDSNFHARYMVKYKTYKYVINCGEYNPIERNYVYQYCKKLDVDKMKLAIKDFIGAHDFKCFVSDSVVKENYVREIYDASIDVDNNKIVFSFTATGFMKYQVRNMVGTLVKIGNGKLNVDFIKNVFLDNTLKKYITTIKPEGLYLVDIEYFN